MPINSFSVNDVIEGRTQGPLESQKNFLARSVVEETLSRAKWDEAAGTVTLSSGGYGLFEGHMMQEIKDRRMLRDLLEGVAADAFRDGDRRKKAEMGDRKKWRLVQDALEPYRGRLDEVFGARA